MPRKNSRVRRSNDRGRLARREFGEKKRSTHREFARVPLESLVMPDGQCFFQSPRKPKARFATPEKAQAALEQAQKQRARVGSTHVEKRWYACPEGGCGGYHLSSREHFDEEIWKLRRAQYEQKHGLTND